MICMIFRLRRILKDQPNLVTFWSGILFDPLETKTSETMKLAGCI
jgi:hypothetical protein